MKIKNLIFKFYESLPRTFKLLFLLGCFGIIILPILELNYWKTGLDYQVPIFSSKYLIRSIIIAFTVSAILISISRAKKSSNTIKQHDFKQYQILSVIIVLSILLFTILLWVCSPELFNLLAKEDNIIEWLSFICLICGSIFFILSCLKVKSDRMTKSFIHIILAFLSILYIIMAMEEISWGQRVFGIRTFDFFINNSQNENNFHNFNTLLFEIFYNTGLYILLILLPFLQFILSGLFSERSLNLFIPAPYLIIIGSLPFGINYNKWNIIFTQIWYFSILITMFILILLIRRKNERQLFILGVTTMIMIQGLILFYKGDYSANVLEKGDIGEYKELLSQIALLIYSFDVFKKAKNQWIELIPDHHNNSI